MESKRRVLFVEDTTDTRNLVEFALENEGFKVVTAQTAEAGLAEARKSGFALILLDIGLPDCDGLELCRQIRQFDSRTPILFYTAYGDLLDLEEAKRAGAQGCLRKPEDTARLGEITRSTIEEAG
jgi:DNA-binding response OmpR family regulator